MKVLYPITLDVKKTNVQKVIHANQGEGLDRKLIVTLVSGSEPIILDNENQSVQFVAKKPDGTTIYNATAIKDGKAILYLTTQTVAAVGDVDCQLEVVSTDEGSVGSGVIYSAKFTIAVEEALYDEETIESSNEFTELIELIERAEKQVTVFPGEGTPSTDPDGFDNVKESDFYYDSTNKKYYYATTATALTVTWEKLVNITELTALLANYFTKTEVTNLIAKDAVIWHGTAQVNTRNNITEAVEGIKEGDIYIQETEGEVFQQVCVVYLVYNTYYFCIQPINNAYVSSSNPPSSTSANNYISLIDSTIWINSTTNRVYIKTASIGEPPSDTYVWQDLTGNRVFFGTTNPDDGTALGKLTIGTSFVGISKGDIYVCEDNSAYPLTGFENAYYVKSVDSTTAYLKKFNKIYFMDEAPPEYGAEGVVAAVLDKDEIFEEGTVWIKEYLTHGSYIRQFFLLTHIQQTQNNLSQVTIKYTWKTLEYAEPEDIADLQEQINEKQDKIDSDNKLDADIVDDTDSTNKFTNATEKAAWNAKQNAIDSSHKLDADNVDDSESTNKFVSAAEKAAIGKEPKYELIKTIDISQLSEPVSMIIVDEDENGDSFAVDDILINLSSVKTTNDNSKVSFQWYSGTKNNKYERASSILSTTARNFRTIFSRETEDLFNMSMGGNFQYTNVYAINNLSISEKLDKVSVYTDSTFKEGILKVYGKVKY